LNLELDKVIANKRNWDNGNATAGIGTPGNDLDEMLHHSRVALEKNSTFHGRDELIQSSLDFIINSTYKYDSNNELSSICLAVVGVSGSGKTALMSRLAFKLTYDYKIVNSDTNTNVNNSNIPIIIRFCGTSSGSVDGLELFKSISLQIQCIYNVVDKVNPIQQIRVYEDTVKIFHDLLVKYPVILFIDSLDQLGNANEARRK
jgi:hypothetical protein